MDDAKRNESKEDAKMMRSLLMFISLFVICLPGYTQDDSWVSLNNEAVALSQKGEFSAALIAEKKCLTALQGEPSPLPLDVAEIWDNIAQLYSAQEQYEMAEPFLKRALVVQVKILGPDNLSVAQTLNQLALVYRRTNRTSGAEYAEMRAAAIERLNRTK